MNCDDNNNIRGGNEQTEPSPDVTSFVFSYGFLESLNRIYWEFYKPGYFES